MSFVEVLFTIVAWLHWPLILGCIFFAYQLLVKRKGQAISFNFGLCITFMGLWIFVTVTDIFRLSPFVSEIHERLAFFMGLWTLHYFLMFSFYYPVQSFKNKYLLPSFYGLTIIISSLSLIPGFATISSFVDFPFLYNEVNPVGLTVYSIYFLFLGLLAFSNLLKAYENIGGMYKDHIRKILFGTILAMFMNFFLSLMNAYYTTFDLTPIGIVFTFFVLNYIYRIMYPRGFFKKYRR